MYDFSPNISYKIVLKEIRYSHRVQESQAALQNELSQGNQSIKFRLSQFCSYHCSETGFSR